jgi:primosomal protein N' (replication factor Y)
MRFRTGEIRLLCGTQMIAKGLDVPGVRLVGVVNADTSLNFPDFRASERTFQLVSQVVGRCGRGADIGTALIQTFQPDSLSISKAAEHDFEGFAEQELRDREAFGLPPIRRMVRFLVRDASEQRAWTLAEDLSNALGPLASPLNIEIRPPSACPIARVARRYRVQLEAIAPSASLNSRLLAEARSQGVFSGPLSLGETVAVDVDPVSML